MLSQYLKYGENLRITLMIVFCMVNFPKCNFDLKCMIYPNISSIGPVDSDDSPIPFPPEKDNSTHSYASDESLADEMTSDKDYYSGFESRKHVIT